MAKAANNGAAGRVALVTGASSGIGQAMCRLLAREGYDLVITARREERLLALQRELGGAVAVHVVALDLGKPESPQQLHDAVQGLGLHIDTLINNAGYALPGEFLQTRWQDQARLIQVLATAPAQLIHLFVPAMVARGYGRVLNVGSIGSYAPASPQMTLYAALKHFVLVTSRSLAAEHRGSGVSFTALCPGPTATEWAKVSNMRSTFDKLPQGLILSAEQVAGLGYRALMRGEGEVVTGLATRLVAALMPLIPQSFALKWLAKNAPG